MSEFKIRFEQVAMCHGQTPRELSRLVMRKAVELRETLEEREGQGEVMEFTPPAGENSFTLPHALASAERVNNWESWLSDYNPQHPQYRSVIGASYALVAVLHSRESRFDIQPNDVILDPDKVTESQFNAFFEDGAVSGSGEGRQEDAVVLKPPIRMPQRRLEDAFKTIGGIFRLYRFHTILDLIFTEVFVVERPDPSSNTLPCHYLESIPSHADEDCGRRNFEGWVLPDHHNYQVVAFARGVERANFISLQMKVGITALSPLYRAGLMINISDVGSAPSAFPCLLEQVVPGNRDGFDALCRDLLHGDQLDIPLELARPRPFANGDPDFEKLARILRSWAKKEHIDADRVMMVQPGEFITNLMKNGELPLELEGLPPNPFS